ncbi:hypothetical protein [Nostoc sp. C110]|uniref:hypothetical protein n=1 Tax=Nostoc sp. C110 TaxID=3349876 RepID=UPI00370DBE5B
MFSEFITGLPNGLELGVFQGFIFVLITEERQRAGGSSRSVSKRRQEEENIFFVLCQTGLKPLNLFMNKDKKWILRRAAQKIQRPL